MSVMNGSTWQKYLNSIIPYLLLLGILAISLLSLASHISWALYLELFSHFKLQYLGLSLILFTLLAITCKKPLILIGLFLVVINLTEVASWQLPPILGSTSTSNLRVLSSNINIQNNSYSKVLSFVKKENPDIAVFMEVNGAWVKQLSSLSDILPYSFTKPNPYNSGMAVYSRMPLENAAINLFGTSGSPSIVSSLKINGKIVSFIAAHPPPPFKPDSFYSRNKQLDEIRKYVQQLTTPVVIAGDLNVTMWSPYYKRFVSKTGLHNARKGFGVLPSWPTKATYSHYSKFPGFVYQLFSIPIDHCLISPDIKVSKIRTGRNVDSDHLPLITDLVIPKK